MTKLKPNEAAELTANGDELMLSGSGPQAPRMQGSMRAQWTYDSEAVAYYFAPLQASPPPYNTREVKAILDIANDGTLAGVELVEMGVPLPPPPIAAPVPHISEDTKND